MMDFANLIKDSDLYTFHSHTQFCDGHAPMELFAIEAIRCGFAHYGFTPHCPIPIESPCNMAAADVATYKLEVERLRSLHADSPTRFYTAMEVDYLGTDFGPSSAVISDYGLDYVIGSIHFIPSLDGTLIDIDGRFDNFRRKMALHFKNDIRYVVNTYFDRMQEMISRGGFDILGHYDKVRHNAAHFHPGIEQETWFNDRLSEVTDQIIDSRLTVEINTKALADHNRFFPDTTLWKRLTDANLTLTINSDAHDPHLIDAGRQEALSILRSL